MKENRQSIVVTVMLVIVGVTLVMAGFIWLFQKANKADQAVIDKNKQCYRELTAIVKQSSPEQARWIENTVSAEKYALGGVNYCEVLKLVKEAN